jgi:hypothetical protein
MMVLDRGILLIKDKGKSREIGEKIIEKEVRNILRYILVKSTVQISVLLHTVENIIKKNGTLLK